MEQINPYLALRAEKIARNEARLKELGLLRPTTTRARVTKSEKQKKSEKPLENHPTLPLRRSSRHKICRSSQPTTYLDLPEPKRKKLPKKDKEGAENDRTVSETPVKIFPVHSARAMDMNVNEIVSNKLGKMMERAGKAFVMEEAAQLCSHYTTNISFNKYSGVQEWKNDAMFLWVNLGNGGDVVNEFLDDGRKITWFGGSRMHEDTNVIRRLLRVGKSAANGSLAPQDGLVLWCRVHNETKRTFTPYVCLGRLSYHSHEPNSQPLKFVLNLMDYDGLARGESIQNIFENLVNNS